MLTLKKSSLHFHILDIGTKIPFFFFFLNSKTLYSKHISLYQAVIVCGFFSLSTTGLWIEWSIFWENEENSFRGKSSIYLYNWQKKTIHFCDSTVSGALSHAARRFYICRPIFFDMQFASLNKELQKYSYSLKLLSLRT